MLIAQTPLPEVLLIEPKIFRDERGFLMESCNKALFDQGVGREVAFAQDNHSRSTRGVLRGLHYQLPPHAQGKLVRAVVGETFDIAVYIRRSSPNFGKWTGVYLSAENTRQIWIPEGFAHSFLTISDVAEFIYKASGFYAPQAERLIIWDDPEIGIGWPTESASLLAEKDAAAPRLAWAEAFA